MCVYVCVCYMYVCACILLCVCVCVGYVVEPVFEMLATCWLQAAEPLHVRVCSSGDIMFMLYAVQLLCARARLGLNHSSAVVVNEPLLLGDGEWRERELRDHKWINIA